MQLFQEGDEEAFKELVRRFKDPIVSFASRMLNDREKAVDIAQETFIKVFTHADSYRPVAGFSGWLFRIAHNLAINEIRRQKRRPAELEPMAEQDGGHGPMEPTEPGLSAEETILGRERRETVRRCVAALPVKYRSAVVMKDMEGMTFEEIAAILGCPESTVKSRVMRARRMLQRKLEPYLTGAAVGGRRPQTARLPES